MNKFFLLFTLITPLFFFSQTAGLTSQAPITPDAIMDTVFDRFGNKHFIGDLKIEDYEDTGSDGKMILSTPTCTAGMFVVYFANGSGMEITTNPLHATRRQTVCEVLSNISGLLGYNSSYPNSALVKLLVDDISTHTFPMPPSTSGVLGLATGFYVVPWNPMSLHPGITENMIEKTIKSRVNGWNNVISMLAPVNSNSFFHGLMAFNFSNSSINWNSGISSLASPGQYDLYTVILHEVTHALGFASLISASGLSKFGPANNYYSNYDRYLNYTGTSNNLIPLLSSTNTCTSNYDLTYTASPILLAPGCSSTYVSDVSNCPTAIKYNSTLVPNLPVYTPACYEGGSSLSHFEDMCYPTNNPANNNLYFSMSNANGPGTNKRYLKDEEKNVLCDLGYTVTTSYTSNAVSASHNYAGSTCSVSPVWGVNDGLNGNAFLFTTTGAPVSIPITGSGGVIANDYQGSNPVTTITCVESVYNNGTAVITGTNIVFTPSNSNGGIFVIRYIPTTISGSKGNITYIFGFVFPSFCGSVSPCDMVQNGGFENNSGCGSMPIGSSTLASCWLIGSLSPDIFVRNCTTNSGAPLSPLLANLGTNTYSSNPVFNSFNGAPNNGIVGIGALSFGGELGLSESLTNYLGAPILNNQAYTLSFWAYQYAGYKADPLFGINGVNPMQAFNTSSVSAVLSFATDSLYVPAPYSVQNYPYAPLTTIQSVSLANSFNVWQHYSITFTTVAINLGNWLYVGMDKNLTYNSLVNAVGAVSADGHMFYTLLDDISLRPAYQAPQLSFPSKICTGQSLINLGQYVNTIGGVFSGVGITTSLVSTSSGPVTQYNFNASQTLTNGLYTITYTYTDNINCVQTAIKQVNIGNVNNGVVLAYASGTTCVNGGTLSVISPSSSIGYTWQPGNFAGNNYTVAPGVTTTYSLTGALNGTCSLSGSINVVPNQAYVQLTSKPNPVCPGSPVQIYAVGNYTSITWQPGTYTTGVINVNANPITYSVMVTNQFGCTSTASLALIVGSLPTLNIVASGSFACWGAPVTLTASGASSYYWSNSYIVTPTISVYSSVNTIYTVTGTGTNNCQSTATIMVKAYSPSITVIGASEICAGESVTLSAQSGANVYAWQPLNLYAPTIVVSPNTSSIYTLNATLFSSNGSCVGTNTVQVNVNPCLDIDSQSTLIQKIKVFPNPNDGTFSIVRESNSAETVSIYNDSGTLLKRVVLNDSNNGRVVITDLLPGFYVIESGRSHVKLIISQ